MARSRTADPVLADGTHRHLRLEGDPELADDDHVERGIEGTGHLVGHGNAAAGETEDHDVIAAIRTRGPRPAANRRRPDP